MSSNTSLARVGFDNLGEAMKFAEMIAKSTMVPKDYIKQPENVLIAVMMGAELGLKPFQAIQNIAVINGRPSVWGDAALGLIQAHPEFEYIEEQDLETITKNSKAVCAVKRKDQPLITNTFSMEDAKKAGLANKQGPWTTYPARMLKMRARAFCLRDAFADVLKGVNIAEEAQDIPQEKDITPVKDRIDQLIENKNITKQQKQLKPVQEDKVEVAETVDALTIALERINAANNLEDLKATNEFAKSLDAQDKILAKSAYTERKKLLLEMEVTLETTENKDHWVQEYEQGKTL
jgi:hypothetical protein